MKDLYRETGTVFRRSPFNSPEGEGFASRVRAVLADHARQLQGTLARAKREGARFTRGMAGYKQTRLPGGVVVKTWINPFGLTPTLMARVYYPILSGATEQTYYHGGFIFTPHDNDTTYPVLFLHTFDYVSLSLTTDTYETEVPNIKDIDAETKNVNWVGRAAAAGESGNEIAITWDHGLGSRYRIYQEQDCSGRWYTDIEGGWVGNSGKPGICIFGLTVPTVYVNEDDEAFEFNVVGAAAFGKYLVAISHVDFEYQNESAQAKAGIDSKTATVLYRTETTAWQIAGKYSGAYAFKAPWFFDRYGHVATTVTDTGVDIQSRFDVTLTLIEETNEPPRVEASFTTEVLDTTPAYISSSWSLEYTETEDETGWQDPGPYTKVVNYGWWTDCGVPLWSGAWGDGTPSSYKSALEELGDPDGTCYPNKHWRDYSDLGLEQLEISEATWSNNRYPASGGGGDLYRGAEWYEDSGVDADAWAGAWWAGYRTTHDVYAGGVNNWKYSYTITGKRYIAFDYGDDNEPLAVTMELENVTEPLLDVTIEQHSGKYYERTDWSTLVEQSYSTKEKALSVEGLSQWAVKVYVGTDDPVTVVVSQGGLLGKYQRNKYDDNSDRTYTHDPFLFVTDRVWVGDIDARTLSCIYERTRVSLKPQEPPESAYSAIEDYDFLDRFLCQSKTDTSLVIVVHGSEVFRHDWNGTFGSLYDYRVYGKVQIGQLSPRIHSRADTFEETHLPATVEDEFDGTTRYWLLFSFDPQPRLDVAGQLQSRNKDVMCSTANLNTRFRSTLFGDPVEVYEQLVHSAAWIRNQDFDITDKLVEMYVDQDPSVVVGDGFKLIPITTI